MGEVQITVDCDVLQADGGTRTASICGGYVALHDACSRLVADRSSSAAHPITDTCAAISVGVVDALADARPRLLRGRARRGRHERRDDRRRAASSRCRAPPRASRSRATSSTTCSASPSAASPRSSTRSAELLAEPPPRADASAVTPLPSFVLATSEPRQGARDRRDPRATAGARPSSSVPRPADVPDVDETGDDARGQRPDQGARAGATRPACPRVADDTGLEVDALDGAPGVHSARFAGEHADLRRQRRQAPASSCDGVADDRRGPPASRPSRSRGGPTAREVAAFGEVEGTITRRAAGDSGFGYDPVFVPDEGDGRTFAEMTPAEKHAISHRGRAFRTLADGLRIARPGRVRAQERSA